MPVEESRSTAIVPVESLGTDGIHRCGGVLGSAGGWYSAGLVAWRLWALTVEGPMVYAAAAAL